MFFNFVSIYLKGFKINKRPQDNSIFEIGKILPLEISDSVYEKFSNLKNTYPTNILCPICH